MTASRPLIVCLLTAMACLLTATPAAAQEDPGSVRVSFDGPPTYATLSLDTGLVVTSSQPLPGQSAVQRGTPCYVNDQDVDVIEGLLLSQNDEIFDWGSKSCTGSNLVRFVTIGYGSQADPTQFGGPGGSLTLRLYAGATGNGAFGTRVLTLPLTGLPSQCSISSIAPRTRTIRSA